MNLTERKLKTRVCVHIYLLDLPDIDRTMLLSFPGSERRETSRLEIAGIKGEEDIEPLQPSFTTAVTDPEGKGLLLSDTRVSDPPLPDADERGAMRRKP